MLAGRRDDRPPAPGGARLGERDLGDAAIELASVVVGPDDVEREVLEHPDPDAVAVRGRAVGAAEDAVVDRLGGAREPVAVERAVDDRRHPPAGDRVLAQLEQAGGHRLRAPSSGASMRRGEGPGEDARRRRSTDSVDGATSSGSPRSAAIDVETTPGMPHGSMRSKSARSTVTLSAMPW